MIILIAKNSTPIELKLIPNGCCSSVKDVTIGYDLSGFSPGHKVKKSDLPRITESRLVVEDVLGTEFWFDPKEWRVVTFESKLYQDALQNPSKYTISRDQLVVRPDWEEPLIIIPDPHIESIFLSEIDIEEVDDKPDREKGKGKVK